MRVGIGVFAGLALLGSSALAEAPGTTFHVKASELPHPFATPGVENSSHAVPRPDGALPQVPKGFSISLYASGLSHPRFMALAPNGDVFLSEPDAGKITIFHDGKPSTFASGGVNKPHGLAFHERALYVGELSAGGKIRHKEGA